MNIEIAPGANTLTDWYAVYAQGATATLNDTARANVLRSAQLVDDIIARGDAVYGVNTGFGKLSHLRIETADLATLQENLVLSHTVGVGDPLPDGIVRLVMALKLAALSLGASGVRMDIVELLEQMLKRGVTPVVPSQGSVGASGDLAPLAHISAVMIGRGRARFEGEVLEGREALARAGLSPLRFGPKEGLAMLNGTQVSTALCLAGLFDIWRVFQTSLAVSALTFEGALGSTAPLDPRIHALKPHGGQIAVAAQLRALLDGGDFRELQRAKGRLQDPYSLRCIPQVMGACLEVFRFACSMLETEARSVSDNPLIFADNGDVISGGNFHAEPVAFVADALANVAAEIGGMAERRVAFLLDGTMSGLPAFLTGGSGLTSGFMSLQITAAALVAENRQRSHPASIESVPTVGNQEDYVSMATHGARRLLDMARNAGAIVAIELLAATEAMDCHGPSKSCPTLERLRAAVRSAVPSMATDWEFSHALDHAQALVTSGEIVRLAGFSSVPH
jgi:histidine ammonia-lyase